MFTMRPPPFGLVGLTTVSGAGDNTAVSLR
jgi:hypothetical protein